MTLKGVRFFFQVTFYLFYISVYGAVDVSYVTLIGGTGPVGAGFLHYFSNCCDLNIKVIGRKNSPHFKAIQDHGLNVNDEKKQRRICISQLFDSCTDIENASQDFVLVTLKQPCFTEEIACQIKRIIKTNGMIAFAWNGIPFYLVQFTAKEKKISDILKDSKLIHINPFIAGEKITPGCLKINTELDLFFIQFSEIQNINNEDVKRFMDFLQKVKIPLKQNQFNFKELILEKLKYSLAISTLSALEERPLDAIFHGEKYECFIHYCIETINKIGEQMGLTKLKSYDDFKKHPPMHSHYSSLYHDIKNKLPNEIQDIVSKTLYLATKANIEYDAKINLSPLLKLYFILHKKSYSNFLPTTNSPLLKKATRGFCP